MQMVSEESNRRRPDAGAPYLTAEVIEGRLLAQRRVLGMILAQMQRAGIAGDLMETLDSLSVMQDHQEDPGAVISGPEAIEGAIALEIHAIARAGAPERATFGESGQG